MTTQKDLIAASLAGRLCFRLAPFLAWVESQGLSYIDLCRLHSQIVAEGIVGDTENRLLVAFVNGSPL